MKPARVPDAGCTSTGDASTCLACDWSGTRDLDDDAAEWRTHFEGEPIAALDAVSRPSIDGSALRCGIEGGQPYSNVHCYRNLPAQNGARALVARFSFWYGPPSTFDDDGASSSVQALEFSASKYARGKRYEAALQWQNVGIGAPQWRYWDPTSPSTGRWVPLDLQQAIGAEHWHTLELHAEILDSGLRYVGFTLDGRAHQIGVTAPAVPTPDPDKLAIATQVDGNAGPMPSAVWLDRVSLEWCSGAGCRDARTFYEDKDQDGFGDAHRSITACDPPPLHALEAGDCDDASAAWRPGSLDSSTFRLDRCGQGEVLEGMAEPTSWRTYLGGHGEALTLDVERGCSGDALRVQYELPASPEANWVVARRELRTPVDLSRADFLLVPLRGTSNLARTLELKLEDGKGCRAAILLTAVTDLPVMRTAILPLGQFGRADAAACAGIPGTTDLTNITAVELGVSEAGSDVPSPAAASTGRLVIDDLSYVSAGELRAVTDFFECPSGQGVVMSRIARDLVRRQKAHGFLPSWYPERAPTYNIYTQALALVVTSYEYARTGLESYRDAAIAIADRMVSLQTADDAWFDVYADDAVGALVPATQASWLGNVAWSVISLRVFLKEVDPPEAAPYSRAVRGGLRWLQNRRSEYSAGAGGLTDGAEGNLSAYFAFAAGGAVEDADLVAQFLRSRVWEPKARYLRMGANSWGLAIDVMGNWGAEFFQREHDLQAALDGLGLAAGVFPVLSWDGGLTGLGDIAGPWQPTTEFTAQYCAAGGRGGRWLLQQLDGLEDPDAPGAFQGAPSDFAGGDGWNTSMTGIAPSAWMYLAHRGGFLSDL